MLGDIVSVPAKDVENYKLQPISKIVGVANGLYQNRYVNLIGLRNNEGFPIWFEDICVCEATELEKNFYYTYLQYNLKFPQIDNIIFLGCFNIRWITVQLYSVKDTDLCLAYYDNNPVEKRIKKLALNECVWRRNKLIKILKV